MYHYTSDLTHFITDFLQKNPLEKKNRLAHRGRLWDVELNFEELDEFKKGGLSKCPYTYFPNLTLGDDDGLLSD